MIWKKGFIVCLTICHTVLIFLFVNYIRHHEHGFRQHLVRQGNQLFKKDESYDEISNLNCLHEPLGWNQSKILSSGEYAYAWYAAQPLYLCSALVAFQQLKKARQIANVSRLLNIDFILIHTMNEEEIAPEMQNTLKLWREEGGIVQKFLPLQNNSAGYYRGCHEKFYIFRLVKYTRIILLDADGLPLREMDHLFLIDLPEGIKIAAPVGYWFPNDGLSRGQGECIEHPTNSSIHVITSGMLMVKPENETFSRVSAYIGKHFKSRNHDYFDMDIINQEFSCKKEVFVLPKMYCTLNSEFLKSERLSVRMGPCKNFSQVHYLHFSGRGKPWSYTTKMTQYVDFYEEDATDAIKSWFTSARTFCPSMFNYDKK